MDIKYLRQYITVFPGIVFPVRRNNRKNFLRESVEARLIGVKDTGEHIPKNTLFCPIAELLLSAENHIAKNKDFPKNSGLVIRGCRYYCFHDNRGRLSILVQTDTELTLDLPRPCQDLLYSIRLLFP